MLTTLLWNLSLYMSVPVETTLFQFVSISKNETQVYLHSQEYFL